MSLALDVGANIYNQKDHSTDSTIIVFRLVPLLALYTYLIISKYLSDKEIFDRLKSKIKNLKQNPITDSNPIRLLEIYINLFFDHYHEDFHFLVRLWTAFAVYESKKSADVTARSF